MNSLLMASLLFLSGLYGSNFESINKNYINKQGQAAAKESKGSLMSIEMALGVKEGKIAANSTKYSDTTTNQQESIIESVVNSIKKESRSENFANLLKEAKKLVDSNPFN